MNATTSRSREFRHDPGPPLTVTLDLPGCVRARLTDPVLSRETVTELGRALTEAEATAGIRTFVIESTGAAFCTGMPLTGGRTPSDVLEGVAQARGLLTGLARSPLVTVAVVDGRVTGGGVALAGACDQVIVGSSATFRITELLVGLLPAILLPVVARRVGEHRAFTWALTAARLDARTATASGLADRMAEDTEAELRSLLREQQRTDPAAVRALKRYRDQIRRPESVTEELALCAFGERLADPAARSRLNLLAEQGLLP
ncbi:enoyl-CoA hydratase-related protein (plasmid) [Streptomyces globisporus]|uniref:enoyl-CoA hydratase-related protein n=1 Tax=Streptomyces globisporus TaxID=1908 RepID=UPI003866D27E|nr:enoyl-CoA hydratase-related protein [Streptomyces globisporus]